METRYRVYQRGNGIYYLEDGVTHKQESLRTRSEKKANALLVARNQAVAQPVLNLTMAKAYLAGRSPELTMRTWDDVMKDLEKCYRGPTLERWRRLMASPPCDLIRKLPLVQTDSSHFLMVLRHPRAVTSTNLWLRRLHNYALDLGWLLAPVMARKAWPAIRYKVRYAITANEHARILAAEPLLEKRLYYELLWQTGGSQSDIANLRSENIDWEQRVVTFWRMKLLGKARIPVQLVMGQKLEELLKLLPQSGWLFPTIRLLHAKDRASRFRKRCLSVGILGKCLHSYRYGWAERACEAGMPEREAMAHLGHKSPAVHLAYAVKARILTMPLEYYGSQRREKILHFSPS